MSTENSTPYNQQVNKINIGGRNNISNEQTEEAGQLAKERERVVAEKQRMFALRAGKPGKLPVKTNLRSSNKLRSTRKERGEGPDFTLVYGVAIFWDIVGFLVGLIPIVGWVLNLCVIVPVAVFNLYLMCRGRGVDSKEFWGAFKYIFGEAIPYINIIPFYTRSIYLVHHPKINEVVHLTPPHL